MNQLFCSSATHSEILRILRSVFPIFNIPFEAMQGGLSPDSKDLTSGFEELADKTLVSSQSVYYSQ